MFEEGRCRGPAVAPVFLECLGRRGTILVRLLPLEPCRDGVCHDVPHASVCPRRLDLERPIEVRIEVNGHLHRRIVQHACLLASMGDKSRGDLCDSLGSPAGDSRRRATVTEPATATHPILAAAQAILPDVIEVRRRLHRRPELGLELPETQAVIVEGLRALGLEPKLGGTSTSVVAVIEGGRPGPTILLRGDMDALPLTEDTGLDFASEVPGVMHACGHDTHVAMLLGAARLLVQRKEQLAGRVLLMFQPGEEGPHGARLMLEEGLLEEGPHGAGDVQRAVAIHISTRYAAGTILLRPGALMASADEFRGTVRGRGGHASTPHLSLDPIPTAAELVLALQMAVTRSIDVFDPTVLTIARISGGTTSNIIPETVEIEGTIRTVSPKARETMHNLVRRVAK